MRNFYLNIAHINFEERKNCAVPTDRRLHKMSLYVFFIRMWINNIISNVFGSIVRTLYMKNRGKTIETLAHCMFIFCHIFPLLLEQAVIARHLYSMHPLARVE